MEEQEYFKNIKADSIFGYIFVKDILKVLIPGVIIAIVCTILEFVYMFNSSENLIGEPESVEMVLGIFLSIGALMVVGSILYAYDKRRQEWRSKGRKQKASQSRISNINDNICEIKKQIEENNNNIFELEKVREELKIKFEEEKRLTELHISEIEKEIAALTQEVAVYDDTLKTEYKNLLNPADWHNIDLCIYYLQTGRADTIKESLLLTDRQRQTDEIVDAVEAASDRISLEIRSGFRALGETMVSCFNALCAQINTVGNTLLSQLDSNAEMLALINKNSVAQLSAAQLNNALLAKANDTSEELLRDYKYVQSLSGIQL